MPDYRNRAYLLAQDPRLAEALDDVMNAVTTVARQTNAHPTAEPAAPPPISALNVVAAGGIFEAALTDNAPVSRGIHYFLEYSTTPAFVQPVVVDLGTSRNWRQTLGNLTLYFRAYSQYSTSGPSAPVYFGPAAGPTPVAGGGAVSGPAPLPSAGSGTASGNGTQGASGFGKVASRSG